MRVIDVDSSDNLLTVLVVNSSVIHNLNYNKKYDNKKSVGFYNISIDTQKNVVHIIKFTLAVLFNISLGNGNFPNCLKQSIVVTIIMKGIHKSLNSVDR